MATIKSLQIGHLQLAYAADLAAVTPRVGMAAKHRRLECLGSKALWPGFGFLQTSNDARLFPLQYRRREGRLLQYLSQYRQRCIALLRAAQGAQRKPGAIRVETSAQLRTHVGHAACDLVVIQSARAQAQQVAREIGHAALVGGLQRRTGGKIDADIEDRQIVAFHKIHLGAIGQHPVLDGQAGMCAKCGENCKQC